MQETQIRKPHPDLHLHLTEKITRKVVSERRIISAMDSVRQVASIRTGGWQICQAEAAVQYFVQLKDRSPSTSCPVPGSAPPTERAAGRRYPRQTDNCSWQAVFPG